MSPGRLAGRTYNVSQKYTISNTPAIRVESPYTLFDLLCELPVKLLMKWL